MIVYKIVNKINNKIYVGQDEKNNPKYYGSGHLIKRAIKKYGIENFEKHILEICENKNMLNEKEKYWIKNLNSTNPEIGYNIAEGGHGGNTYTEETKKRISNFFKNRKFSEETLKKRSESRKNKKIHTPESKLKISNAHKGKKLSEEHKKIISEYAKKAKKSEEFLKNIGTIQNYWKGKKHTEETKRKMSENRRGKPKINLRGKKRSIESINKWRESNKGFKHSEEFIKKITGSGNPFYGKKHTDESKKKISEYKKNRTPEQKLETYIKFYQKKMGKYPSEDIIKNKLNQYKNV